MYTLTNKHSKWISLLMMMVLLVTSILPGGQIHAASTDTVAGWTFSATGTSFIANSGNENKRRNRSCIRQLDGQRLFV